MSMAVRIALDNTGNIYFADYYNSCIRKVNTSGIISTVAGNGINGFSGDGGAATDAQLYLPGGVTVDNIGNIYIADSYNDRIRKVNTSGIITTIAGSGIRGIGGIGGPATAAELYMPWGIVVDISGNVYFTDIANWRVVKVDASGIITKIAGRDTAGVGPYIEGGPATIATVCYPHGIALDNSSNIYIADQDNNRVRMINPSGIITTVAGNGFGAPYNPGAYSGDGGPAVAAELNKPLDVAFDSCQNLYIADGNNFRIRKVNLNTACWATGISSITAPRNYSVYPNPATNVIHVMANNTHGIYCLVSTVGNIIQRGSINEGNNTIPINALPTGLYILEVVDIFGHKSAIKFTKE